MKGLLSESVRVRREFWIYCGLVLLTLAVYWPVVNSEFINLDDDLYVSANPHIASGLNRGALSWAFTTNLGGYWIPLTWLSYELDCHAYGLNPHGFHFTNLLLHVANSVLLFGFLRRTTGTFWSSAFVAALFAWHPLRVESVAWIAERKDVLSTFFGLLALLAYTSYAGAARNRAEPAGANPPPIGRHEARWTLQARAKLFYGLALLLFTLSLMAKPMLVTMPFLLLLLDYWPLNRIPEGGVGRAESKSKCGTGTVRLPLLGLLTEKLPFLGLAAGFSVITFLAQRAGGAVPTLAELPLVLRLENAVVAYAVYLGKSIWPHGLCVPYPYVRAWPASTVVGSALLLGGVTWVVLIMTGRQRALFTGWFWFL